MCTIVITLSSSEFTFLSRLRRVLKFLTWNAQGVRTVSQHTVRERSPTRARSSKTFWRGAQDSEI